MIGQAVTLVREGPGERRYTIRGEIKDVTMGGDGVVRGVVISGVRVEDGVRRDSWYALGDDALHGSVMDRQTCTLDACGHEVTARCACG